MATQNLGHIEVVGTISGNAPQMWNFEMATTQTIYKGSVISLNATGYGIIAIVDEDKIVGVAMEPVVSTSANESISIAIANSDTIFRANVYAAAAADAITSRVIVGHTYDLTPISNQWHVDLTQNTPRCQILRLDPDDAVGDTYGRVWFQFIKANRALASTS